MIFLYIFFFMNIAEKIMYRLFFYNQFLIVF